MIVIMVLISMVSLCLMDMKRLKFWRMMTKMQVFGMLG